MCGICGCGQESTPGTATHGHEHHHHHHHHGHDHDHDHGHDHDHDHGHDHDHDHDHGHDHDAAETRRRVQVEQDLLAKNDRIAAVNRARLDATHTLAVNLMSSPGAGKTTLLCRTLELLKGQTPLAVVEGDQQTSFDADRIRATGVPAHQVNTGAVCHLDASMLLGSFELQAPPEGGILFIENVGNLVCPAGFDLGEHKKVVVVSVTEGEDKPLKYPYMFAKADLVLVNKVDLLPHLDFDLERLMGYLAQIRPEATVLKVSARSGEGMESWLAWLGEARSAIA
ncbi:MAG: hydrogenase nickel incorporation protein HypB [Myxococcales bacterium]|nr:hydrogenase nickel incorporation protein HypB [Myxococcales bacterium]